MKRLVFAFTLFALWIAFADTASACPVTATVGYGGASVDLVGNGVSVDVYGNQFRRVFLGGRQFFLPTNREFLNGGFPVHVGVGEFIPGVGFGLRDIRRGFRRGRR